ncbi:MAG: CoA-binding protein [Treponema sp.]|jgi:redox-sensing transcriptional repressor|nr:CoA-binding protein [Treponema sp.]
MNHIPEPAKERLLYLLRLLEKNRDEGSGLVTSAMVEELTGWHRDTIRKDISWLGNGGEAAGTPGGYNPQFLIPAIRKALGLDRVRRFCVVGLGRLGSAYLDRPFAPGPGGMEEFELAAGFDTNVNRVEILKSSVPLYPAYKMGEVISRFGIEMALLCVPAGAARDAAGKLAAAGIRGIINFAPAALALPPDITVRNVYLADELRALAVKLPPSGC